MLDRIFRIFRAELVLEGLIATVFWTAVLGWQASYEPTPYEKEQCRKTAEVAGRKPEECKSLWEKTTSDPVAFFTFVLAASTISLWLVTWFGGRRQSRQTRESIKLARDEFVSAHRPKMRLKHAWFTDQLAWRLGGPLEINLDFVNIGNTSAHIQWVNYQSLLLPVGQRLPQRPPYDELVSPNVGRITRFRTLADLESGITLPRPVCDGILDAQEVLDILWGRTVLYLIGTIEYWDYAGLRQTAFCRRFTYENYPPAAGDMGRFIVECDPDYEYED
jgi:hypothetical protein